MIRMRQIKLPLGQEDFLKDVICKTLHIEKEEVLDILIQRKSLDARKKENIHYVFEVDVSVRDEKRVLRKSASRDIFLAPKEIYQFPEYGKMKMNGRPIIVGSGPAGLFCAYLLAEHGYRPIIIERGDKMEKRMQDVLKFWETGKLDLNSNVQFGEGGAGTFSDGKLNTMVKDKLFRGKKVFEIFVKHGAPMEIMYLQKPHIGTDLLRDVVVNIRNSILQLGGEFYYSSCLTDIFVEDDRICAIEINGAKRILCSVVVLAIGHSARDTFSMLYNRGVSMEAKPFSVGVRIQHPQEMIQYSQYKTLDKRLPVADYKLTYTTESGRGVYSFCMCPGGYVVNASSEERGIAVNGMSYHARDSKNANSALVVNVSPDDFGHHPLDGISFQRKLEEKAFLAGCGNIPVQLYQDFKNNISSSSFQKVLPVIKGRYQFSNLRDVLPDFVCSSLLEAMPVFGKKIQGFDREDAIMAGVESRTSSPVRILRDDTGQSNILGLYPCGEGSGYAGGITTAAMDGIRVSEWIAKQYAPFNSN